MGIFELIVHNIDAAIADYIVNAVIRIIVFIKPIFKTMLIIYVAIYGILMMYGTVSEPIKDVVFRVIRIGLIIALALSSITYNQVIVKTFAEGPAQVAGKVTGSPAVNAGAIIDSFFKTAYVEVEKLMDKAGIFSNNFIYFVVAFLLILAVIPLCIFLFYLFMLSKIMTTLLLAVGPIFIIFALFKPTEKMFESWVSQLCNFAILLILASALGSLLLTLCTSLFTEIKNLAGTETMELFGVLQMLIVGGVSLLVAIQIPELASSLGGGIAVSTHRAMSKMAGYGKDGVKYGAKTAGRAKGAGLNAYKRLKKGLGGGNQISSA